MSAQYRLGIDAGGTFTDFVIADRQSGETSNSSRRSRPPPIRRKAIENGLQLIAEDLGLDAGGNRLRIATSASTARRSASMR